MLAKYLFLYFLIVRGEKEIVLRKTKPSCLIKIHLPVIRLVVHFEQLYRNYLNLLLHLRIHVL